MTDTVAQFSNVRAVVDAIRRAARNLVPPADMLPSEWAQQNIRIPVGNAVPGPINFDNAPYQRGMLDAVKEPGVRRVTLQTGAQLGKTTVLQCASGYFIAHEPRSQIMVQPTQGDMQTFMETKLRPMFDANPSIRSVMAKQRGRDGVNNSRMISYIGGWLMMSWAGSPKTLRGRSAPVTMADEIDGYDVTAEGDPVQLLVQRSATFGDQALLIESSTPTIKGESRVEAGFQQGDQRRYFVPCPDCGHAQFLRWGQVTWEGKDTPDGEQRPETAVYACESCGSCWDDGMRVAAIRNAERLGAGWKAEKPFRGHASFHAPEMLSTFRRLRDIVQSYLDKMAVGDLQSFVNVSLAETYEEAGDKVDVDSLKARREVYAAPVPAGGVYLTAGVDMQQDRLEVEVVAWGVGEESWSVEYAVLWGDPLAGDVWNDLDDYLAQEFQHASGRALPISAACLDTGGTSGYTQAAYDYARGKTGRRLFAIKGVSGWDRAIVEKPQRKQSGKNARKVDLFLVGVDQAKLLTMRRLANPKPGPGFCHVPHDRDDEWFRQVTAETLRTRYVKGQPVREWHKPDRARNEALDCRCYAYAALKIMVPNLKRLADRLNSQEFDEKLQKMAENSPKNTPDPVEKQPEIEPENGPEETKPTGGETLTIKKTRKLAQRGRKNWATQW